MKNEFKKGNKIIFFTYWCKFIPLSLRIHDKKTITTEFFMNIYFSIYKIHPFINKKNNINKNNKNISNLTKNISSKFSLKNFHKVIKDFKKYLILQGDELTKIEELLPYFALPYMKNPHCHPLFKNLFSEEWILEMEKRLEDFLGGLYDSEKESLLIKIYKSFLKGFKFKNEFNLKNDLKENFENKNNFDNKNDQKNFVCNHFEFNQDDKNERDIFGNKKKSFKIRKKNKNEKREIFSYMKKLEDDNKRLTSIIEEFHKKSKNSEKKYEEKKKNEKIISIQIQKKWAIFTQEIINLTKNLFLFANQFKKGKENYLKKIKNKIKNFENFLQINKTDLNNNISINENEISVEDFKIDLFKYLNQKFIYLDFKKIKIDLLKNDFDKKKIILDNLKEVFFNSSEYSIRTYSILLLEEDFFDFEKNKEILKHEKSITNSILKDSKKKTQENKQEKNLEKDDKNNLFKILSKNKKTQITFYEIINKLSLDYLFRGSLIKNTKIITNLIKILKSEKSDTKYRQIILALLQKISLRRKAQNLMLEKGVIELIFSILKKEKKNLSDYSKEYFLTLLMNLSLNKKGKNIFEKEKNFFFINLLLEILENCTHSQRHFINGIIYSVLLNEKIKKIALEKNIDKILMKNYYKLDLKFQKQIDFINERLFQKNVNYMKKEEFGDLDNLYSIEKLEIKEITNLSFLKNYEIKNKKFLKNLKLITNSYFTLFFKNTHEVINFDVTVDFEQPLQRPSTPSYFLKLSNNFNMENNNSKFSKNYNPSKFSNGLENNKSKFFEGSKFGDKLENFDDSKFEDNLDLNKYNYTEELPIKEKNSNSEIKENENFFDSEKKNEIENENLFDSGKKNEIENENLFDSGKKNKEFFESDLILEKHNENNFEKSSKKNDSGFFNKNCEKSNTDKKNKEENESFLENEKSVEWKQGFISKPLIERTPLLDK